MARPLCPRRIAHRPPADYFKPAGIPLYDLEEVEVAADEIEALRLADVDDLYHGDAAAKMGVSRQTFDRIVRRARMKVAAALVHGQALRILRPVEEKPARARRKKATA
jgi:uncharacterized protein